METTLDKAQVGHEVKIQKVGGSSAIRLRLMHMGIVKGATVRVERVAPLGDPVEITVRGYQLAIRKKEAALIEITENEPQQHEHTRAQ